MCVRGAETGQSATTDELIAWCRKNLASFKCPRYVVFTELPKTSTGQDSEVQAARDGEGRVTRMQDTAVGLFGPKW